MSVEKSLRQNDGALAVAHIHFLGGRHEPCSGAQGAFMRGRKLNNLLQVRDGLGVFFQALPADAAALVFVEYEPLPSVTATSESAQPGAPAVWDEAPDNVAFVWEAGDRAAVARAFDLLTGEAALGTDEDTEPARWRGHCLERAGERDLGGFPQAQAEAIVIDARQPLGQRPGNLDLGHDHAAALLGRLTSHTLPASSTLAPSGRFQPDDGALGEDGPDAGDAELGAR